MLSDSHNSYAESVVRAKAESFVLLTFIWKYVKPMDIDKIKPESKFFFIRALSIQSESVTRDVSDSNISSMIMACCS